MKNLVFSANLTSFSCAKLLKLALVAVMMGATLLSAPARAEKMDAETHTIVIEKMELVLKQGREDETLRLQPIRARLADLYAERARLRAMSEAEKNCQDCKGSENDRKRSIELYKTVIASTPQDQRGPVMMQMAHIYELLNQDKNSTDLYNQVIAGGEGVYGKKLVAQSYAALGEQQFAKGQFAQALKSFQSAIALSEPMKKGYLTYRIAWCHLNMGEQTKAVETLVRLLRTPALLMRDSTTGPVLDESFQEDASRDLATFLCRGNMENGDMKLLESLSPDKAQRDNIHYLASECERLGNKRAALQAWDIFIEHETKPTDRLEAMVRVSQIRYDINEKPKALEGVTRAVDSWKKTGCQDETVCGPLKMRLRKLVMDWNKAEKKKPSVMVLQAYQSYISLFTDDTEMTYWAALVARDLKQNALAASLYHKSSILAAKGKTDKSIQADKEMSKSNAEILEGSLVGEIEMAELAKDFNLREQAYDHYLELNPNGKMAMEVRYQRAHLAYERGDHALAVSRFTEFVSSKECVAAQSNPKGADAAFCIKAADLSLDSLVAMKDDKAIEKQATRLATLIPSRQAEYTRIARKSILNQVSHTTNSTQSSNAELEEALAKLTAVSLVGATHDESVSYWKNRLLLAEKAKNLPETDKAADGLLGVKGLSTQDREFALERVAWAAEMRMDFGKAYSISRNLPLPNLTKDERLLRLALLAELAGRNPRQHEDEYLRIHPHGLASATIRAKMVRQARSPLAELNRQSSEIERYPQVYAPLALEIFAKTNNKSLAEHAIKVRGVVSDPAGMEIARHLFLNEFDALRVRLAASKLHHSSDAVLQASISERLKLLDQAEQSAGRAVRTHDWTLQLVTLATLSAENQRMYTDVMTLPTPRRLKPAQRAQYAKLVAQKAQPFFEKHSQIEAKLQSFWNDDAQFRAMGEEFKKSRPEFRSIIAKDLREVSKVAPEAVRNRIASALGDGDAIPSERQIRIATDEVRAGPFNANRLTALKELEEKRGGDTMVTYLDARLLKLDKTEVGAK